jgi:hypothetical protein
MFTATNRSFLPLQALTAGRAQGQFPVLFELEELVGMLKLRELYKPDDGVYSVCTRFSLAVWPNRATGDTA